MRNPRTWDPSILSFWSSVGFVSVHCKPESHFLKSIWWQSQMMTNLMTEPWACRSEAWGEWTLKNVLVAHLCLTLCNPMGPPGSSVHEILQARILEWVAIPFSGGFSQPRNPSRVSCIADGFFSVWTTREAWMNTWWAEIQKNRTFLYHFWTNVFLLYYLNTAVFLKADLCWETLCQRLNTRILLLAI